MNQMNERGRFFLQEMSQRPGFIRHFTVRRTGHGAYEMIKNLNGTYHGMFRDDPLFWCLSNLSGKPDDPKTINHAHLFTFLETHLSKVSAKRGHDWTNISSTSCPIMPPSIRCS